MAFPLNRLIRLYERSFKRNPSLTLAFTNGCLKCFGDFLAQILPTLHSDEKFVLDTSRSLRFLVFGLLHGPCIGKWHEFLENRVPLTRSNQIELDQDLHLIEGYLDKSALPQPNHNNNISSNKSKNSNSNNTKPNYLSIRSRSQPNLDHSNRFLSSSNLRRRSFRSNRSARFGGLLKRVFLDQFVMAPFFVFVFIFVTAFLEGLNLSEIKERLDNLYWHILTANWKIWPIIQFINFNFMPLQYRVPWQSSCGVLWTVFLSMSTHPTTTTSLSSSMISNNLKAATSSTLAKATTKSSSNLDSIRNMVQFSKKIIHSQKPNDLLQVNSSSILTNSNVGALNITQN